jgi:hypothetical protein
MLIEQIDTVRSQALQGRVGDFLDVRGPAIEAGLLSVLVKAEAELGGDDNLIADRGERFAEQFFIGEGAVDFRGVEERHAEIDRGADERDSLLIVNGRAIAKAQAHAAEAEGGDFEAAVSEFSLLHIVLLLQARQYAGKGAARSAVCQLCAICLAASVVEARSTAQLQHDVGDQLDRDEGRADDPPGGPMRGSGAVERHRGQVHAQGEKDSGEEPCREAGGDLHGSCRGEAGAEPVEEPELDEVAA